MQSRKKKARCFLAGLGTGVWLKVEHQKQWLFKCILDIINNLPEKNPIEEIMYNETLATIGRIGNYLKLSTEKTEKQHGVDESIYTFTSTINTNKTYRIRLMSKINTFMNP